MAKIQEILKDKVTKTIDHLKTTQDYQNNNLDILFDIFKVINENNIIDYLYPSKGKDVTYTGVRKDQYYSTHFGSGTDLKDASIEIRHKICGVWAWSHYEYKTILLQREEITYIKPEDWDILWANLSFFLDDICKVKKSFLSRGN